MNKSEQIALLIRKIAATATPSLSFIGTVDAVNSSDYTCDVKPIDGGAMFHDVRLKPTVDSSDFGVIFIPEKGSHVIVEPIARSPYFYVSQFTKTKTILIKNSNGAQVLFNSNGDIHLNGDQYGGLIIIADLLQAINQLITRFNSHVHPVSGSVAGMQTAPPLQTIQQSSVENKKVKHG